MPVRDTSPVGAPCWVDLSTSDMDATRAFYAAVFGWDAEDPAAEFGGYVNFTKNGVRIAGGMPAMPGAAVSDGWSVHLTSDDAQKTLDTALDHGGQVLVPAMPVGDLGVMSVLLDPGGAAVGAWQPGRHQGFGLHGEDGTPTWFELFTRDHDGAVAFYRDVFGWDTQNVGDTDEFRYTVALEGTEQRAGVMDASGFLGDEPAHWSVYFGASDVDSTIARVIEHGGAVVQPAEDTPYGRIATMRDVNGARFKLVAVTG